MSNLFCIILFFSAFTVVSGQSINNPQQRASALTVAQGLIETSDLQFDPSEVEKKNPFNPYIPEDSVKPDTSRLQVLADRDLLKALTSQLSATGSVQLNGISMLLFGQKKFKLGDMILISFQGATYELEILSIERTNYTLRYKNEQINLPIKVSVNIPATKS